MPFCSTPYFITALSGPHHPQSADALNDIPAVTHKLSMIGWRLVVDDFGSCTDPSQLDHMVAYCMCDGREEASERLDQFVDLLARNARHVKVDSLSIECTRVTEKINARPALRRVWRRNDNFTDGKVVNLFSR